jgi:hypothetical protein
MPPCVQFHYLVENHEMTRDAPPLIISPPAIDYQSVRYPRIASKHSTGMFFAHRFSIVLPVKRFYRGDHRTGEAPTRKAGDREAWPLSVSA